MSPLEVAVAIAARSGFVASSPVVLRETNNLVVWLRPHPIVAKVGTDHDRLARELAVATHLVTVGAPVVGPSPLLSTIIHTENGYACSFWIFEPQGREPSARDVAAALGLVHLALAQLPDRLVAGLPRFEAMLDSVPVLINDPRRLRVLPSEDRHVIARAYDTLRAELDQHRLSRRCIHGSPHRLNVLLVDGKPRFIDFETTCLGPLEWDLAYVESDVAAEYPDELDQELLKICRGLAGVATATWCWNEPERGDLRSHAEYHLAVLKRDFGS